MRWRSSAHCTNGLLLTLTMAGGGWERFEAEADETARVLGAKFVRPGLLPPDEAAALENRADVLVSLGNTYDNQMPSKLFGYFATGKPVLHLAVSENDPTLPSSGALPAGAGSVPEGRRHAGHRGKAAQLAAQCTGSCPALCPDGKALPRVHPGEGRGGVF